MNRKETRVHLLQGKQMVPLLIREKQKRNLFHFQPKPKSDQILPHLVTKFRRVCQAQSCRGVLPHPDAILLLSQYFRRFRR